MTMKIEVTRDGTHIDVTLLTGEEDKDMSVRFVGFDDAVEFAEIWADWIGCDDIRILATATPPRIEAAA